ncbi:hypothetical protein [Portibacter lacus]|uniref:Uncharacterized protein n=1 Tax=Portibacter lacus TaxID=1099794 RepID=A0AA37SRU6_9BACT|nr:hypothetical protein [Portibacter lacus]GLR18379.1 hypothetical protein GCM10007940_29950 [Portibacter lacus]
MFNISHEIKYLVTTIAVLLLFASCKNSRLNKLSEEGKGYVAQIEISAGDYIDHINKDTLDYLTFPFNVGIFENSRKQEKQVFIIGKSIRQGQKISFKPISKLTYIDRAGVSNVLIVARPTELKYVTAKVDNFFELISVHYGIQKMIEIWITYSKGYGEAKEVKWENEDMAINYLTI